MNKTIRIGSKIVTIGDWVCFKSDVEQSGKIEDIHGSNLSLTNDDGFDGGYIGGDNHTIVEASRCWIEE